MIQSENDFFYKTALFIIKVYCDTYTKMKEESKNEYPESSNIPNSTMKCLIDKFEKTGWLHNMLGKGRKW